MRITKKLIERCSMALIMALPVAYLFITQIFALAGAHGEEVLGEPVYVQGEVVSDQFNANTNIMELDSLEVKNSWLDYVFNAGRSPSRSGFTFNGMIGQVTYGVWETNNKTFLFKELSTSSYISIARESNGVRTINENSPSWSFSASNSNLNYLRFGYDGFKYYEPALVASDSIESNSIAYTDYLFGNMFGRENFLTEWGEDVLSENPHGFAPFASMIKYLDVNMLHLGEKNYGLMAYGQLYYMLNVSVFYLIYKTMVFIPNMIAKLFNWFGKENNEND